MRVLGCVAIAGVLSACTGPTIDAGGNDAGKTDDAGLSGGATAIATQVQLAPTDMTSDGTTLFWMNNVDGALWSMPVGGGTITMVSADPVGGDFLTVDATNVYATTGQPGISNGAPVPVVRIAKTGEASPMPITDDVAANEFALTWLLGDAYWIANDPDGGTTLGVRTVPLAGGAPTTLLQSDGPPQGVSAIGATTRSIVLFSGASLASISEWFVLPRTGSLDAGVMTTSNFILSMTAVSAPDAVYAATSTSIERFADDGTRTTLGPCYGNSRRPIALDDTYVYWIDALPVGTVMRVPKTGGTPTVLAHDTSPVAIAVDEHAIYWADVGGNIMRLAK